MWRQTTLCVVLLASAAAAASDDAAAVRVSKPTPSKLDYLVLASLADAPQLLTLARYGTKTAPPVAKTSPITEATLPTTVDD